MLCRFVVRVFFFFKQKTAYELRISDWSSDVCSSDLVQAFQYNGKYYGIPLYLDAKFMGYNKQIFSKLGLSAPANFEQLLSSCEIGRASCRERVCQYV